MNLFLSVFLILNNLFRNFRTAKRISIRARPLESVMKYNKLADNSRNVDKEGYRTFNNGDQNNAGINKLKITIIFSKPTIIF